MGLQPLPGTFAATREALHRVAEQIVAPARKPDNEIALRQTPGGFGTPEFEWQGSSFEVRVAGPELVVIEAGAARRAPLVSLAAAAELVGSELFVAGVPTERAELGVDPVAAKRLGELYEFADAALSRLREWLSASAEPSSINLWPEHFDIAFEAGAESAGERANYGVSPGDEQHAEPYAYVGPWSGEASGELWNATGFAGAELGYAELVAAGDPAALVDDFFRRRFEALAS